MCSINHLDKRRGKNKMAFAKAIEALKNAETFIFSPSVTNEEAIILQKIREKTGINLVCHEARSYQKFMQAYTEVSGKSFYMGSLQALSNSEVIITIGTRIKDDSPLEAKHIEMTSKSANAKVIYMHSLEDARFQDIITQFIKYEVASEVAVIALLIEGLLDATKVPKSVSAFLADLDIGNLSAESSVGEEEIEDLKRLLLNVQSKTLVIGADLYSHPQSKQIAQMLALLEVYADFNVICIPCALNTIGVATICDLSDNAEGKSIGYNVSANFTLSSLGEGDLTMPTINQRDGSIINIDKYVVAMKSKLSYDGYTLNDIACALGINKEHIVAHTKQLAKNKGFELYELDDFPEYYDNLGSRHKAYPLKILSVFVKIELEDIGDIDGIYGAVIYNCNASLPSSELGTSLLGSQQFATATKLKDGDIITYVLDDIRFNREFNIDKSLKGTIALNPTFDMGLESALLRSYRFSSLDFEKVGK